MALLKACSKCGEVIEQGNGSMCDRCASKAKTRHTDYDETRRNKESSSVYNCKQWRDVRHLVKVRDLYMCLLCYSNERIKSVQTVHHIIPVEDDVNRKYIYNPNNLISVCSSCHQQIHAIYEINNVRKLQLQNELREIISKGVVGEG
ncbi:HNH endonuclease [Neobacillus sp. M.A.Huq-85]